MDGGARSRLIAWVTILVASDAADICWDLYIGHRLPVGFVLLRATLLIPFAAISRGPLRRFVFALIAFLCGSWLERTTEHYWSWYQQAPISRQMYADAWLALIPSLLIALTLIGSGLTRRDVYLTRGDLTAQVKGLGPMRWAILAPIVILFLIYGLSEQLRLILKHSGAPANCTPSDVARSHRALSNLCVNQCFQRGVSLPLRTVGARQTRRRRLRSIVDD